jgi:photosystem II stability/assembly factor-like uncharacterized protein
VIRTTGDGGQNWSYQNSGTTQRLQGVKFINAQTGWIVGGGGTILRTTNGGVTWTPQQSGTTASLMAVDFVDAQYGCAVGPPDPNGGSSSTIIYTDNGGQSWQPMLPPSGVALTGVDMVDPDVIYAVGHAGRVLVTIEGTAGSAASWFQQFTGYGDDLMGIRMLDANRGWAAGKNGRIIATEDGGISWFSQRMEADRTLFAIDMQAVPVATPPAEPQRYKYLGWAVGQRGRVVRTDDGGVSWRAVDTGTQNSLRAFRYTDPDSAWAVGDFGTVQRFN